MVKINKYKFLTSFNVNEEEEEVGTLTTLQNSFRGSSDNLHMKEYRKKSFREFMK